MFVRFLLVVLFLLIAAGGAIACGGAGEAVGNRLATGVPGGDESTVDEAVDPETGAIGIRRLTLSVERGKIKEGTPITIMGEIDYLFSLSDRSLIDDQMVALKPYNNYLIWGKIYSDEDKEKIGAAKTADKRVVLAGIFIGN